MNLAETLLTSELAYLSSDFNDILGLMYQERLRDIGLSDGQIKEAYRYEKKILEQTDNLKRGLLWKDRLLVSTETTLTNIVHAGLLTLSELVKATWDADNLWRNEQGDAEVIKLAAFVEGRYGAWYAHTFLYRMEMLDWSEEQKEMYGKRELEILKRKCVRILR